MDKRMEEGMKDREVDANMDMVALMDGEFL